MSLKELEGALAEALSTNDDEEMVQEKVHYDTKRGLVVWQEGGVEEDKGEGKGEGEDKEAEDEDEPVCSSRLSAKAKWKWPTQ